MGIYFGSTGCGNLRCASDMLISLNGSLPVFPPVLNEYDFKLHLKCLAQLSQQHYFLEYTESTSICH